jgi:hypothetical protein
MLDEPREAPTVSGRIPSRAAHEPKVTILDEVGGALALPYLAVGCACKAGKRYKPWFKSYSCDNEFHASRQIIFDFVARVSVV